MAKLVSDNLVISISYKGEETVIDLGRLFNDNPNRVISIVGTVNEDGSPNTAPVSIFYSKDNHLSLLTSSRDFSIKTSKTKSCLIAGIALTLSFN